MNHIRLKELRTKRGLKQGEVAKLLEISQSGYSHYEQGNRVPDSFMLKKIADILNTTADYLLGRTNSEELAIVEGAEVPKELRDIGIDYMEVDRIAKEKGFTPDDIKELIEAVSKLNINKKK